MTHALHKFFPMVLACTMLSALMLGFAQARTVKLDDFAIEAAKIVAQPGSANDPPFEEAIPSIPSVITTAPEPLVPPPTGQLNVVLDWYLTPYHAALIVARERGYFKREGLNVTLSPPADPAVPPKVVAAQHADLALTSQPRLHLLVEQGLPLIRVGTLVPAPLTTLLVRQDRDIDSLAKLQGKTVGYAFEAPARLLLDELLKDQSLTSADVSMKYLDFGLTRSLAEGDVDAVLGGFRHVTKQQLLQEGIEASEFFLEPDDSLPIYDELILVANRDVLKQHQRDIVNFLDALEHATLWLINHPDQAWELVRTAEPGLDTKANALAWDATIRYLALRPAALQVQRYRAFETYLIRRGLIETKTPVERLAIDITASEQ